MQYKSNLLTLLFYKNGAISSDTAPSDTTKLWLDTSVEPNVLKYHDGSNWVMVNDQTAEYKALLEVTSQEINAEVSKKVGQDEIISRINQTAEAVRILASKIQLEGLVTANNYFKINLDGSIEAINGKFSGTLNSPTINGGKITGSEIVTEKDLKVGNNIIVGNEEDVSAKQITLASETFIRRYLNSNERMQIQGKDQLLLGTKYYSETGRYTDLHLLGGDNKYQQIHMSASTENGFASIMLFGEDGRITMSGKVEIFSDLTVGGTFTNPSDKRLKNVISLMDDKMYRVWKNINPVIFEWNELNPSNDKKQFGIIAQEAIAAFESEGLDYNDYGLFGTIELDGQEYLTISYDNYNMMSANALKFAIKEIEEIKKALN